MSSRRVRNTSAVLLIGLLALAVLWGAAGQPDRAQAARFQDTAYPPPGGETDTPDTNPNVPGYPEPETPTETPTAPPGATQSPTTTLAPGLLPETATPGTALPSGTPPSDRYLTEDAEMRLSSATLGPSETPTPSLTPTITPTPLAAPIPPYRLNWGAFSLGFFGALLLPVGGYAGYRYYQRRRRESPLL